MDKKAELFRCGRQMFSEYGFKETSVAAIAKAAGLATGTFYLYYESKEALFLDVYNEENIQLKKHILSEVDLTSDPMGTIQRIMQLNYEGILANPILREWYNRDVFSKIEKSFRETNSLNHVNFLYGDFIEIIRGWQNNGLLRKDIQPEMIMAMFHALIVVETHKEEIGIEFFPELIEQLALFTMRELQSIPSNQV